MPSYKRKHDWQNKQSSGINSIYVHSSVCALVRLRPIRREKNSIHGNSHGGSATTAATTKHGP